MALSKFGVKDIRRMAKLLDPDYDVVRPPEQETLPLVDEAGMPAFTGGTPILSDEENEGLEAMALAALNEALDIIESKAKFALVGQLYWAGGYISAEESRANRVSLGWYTTEKQAYEAGKMLGVPHGSNEEFKVWVVPVHMGSPASFHKKRKQDREAAELELSGRNSVLAAELARRHQWFADHPGETPPPEWRWLGDPHYHEQEQEAA